MHTPSRTTRALLGAAATIALTTAAVPAQAQTLTVATPSDENLPVTATVSADFNPAAAGDETFSIVFYEGYEAAPDPGPYQPTYAEPGTDTSRDLDVPSMCYNIERPGTHYESLTAAKDVDGDGDLDATFWLTCDGTPTEFIAYNDGSGLRHVENADIPENIPAPVAVYDMIKVESNRATYFNPTDNDRIPGSYELVAFDGAEYGFIFGMVDGLFVYDAPQWPQYEALTYTIADDYGRLATGTMHFCEHY